MHDDSQVRVTMVQMPALNTPQFDWVKSRLPHKGQPVPPIYQPEIAAEAIVWAPHYDRRELNVGLSTALVVFLNKLVPGLADRYLAWTGYDAQQTDEPRDPASPNNLRDPVPGDHGAHGRFGHRAHETSWQLWATTHRAWVAAGVGLAGAACLAIGNRKERRKANSTPSRESTHRRPQRLAPRESGRVSEAATPD